MEREILFLVFVVIAIIIAIIILIKHLEYRRFYKIATAEDWEKFGKKRL